MVVTGQLRVTAIVLTCSCDGGGSLQSWLPVLAPSSLGAAERTLFLALSVFALVAFVVVLLLLLLCLFKLSFH